MSDRELLELAAKAAGYDKSMHMFALCDSTGSWTEYAKNVYWKNGRECRDFWNPLTDDGDALRLAVKLRLTTDTSDGMLDGNKYTPATRIDASSGRMLLIELHGADPYAATRRAIVRAAAEIGRTL